MKVIMLFTKPMAWDTFSEGDVAYSAQNPIAGGMVFDVSTPEKLLEAKFAVIQAILAHEEDFEYYVPPVELPDEPKITLTQAMKPEVVAKISKEYGRAIEVFAQEKEKWEAYSQVARATSVSDVPDTKVLEQLFTIILGLAQTGVPRVYYYDVVE